MTISPPLAAAVVLSAVPLLLLALRLAALLLAVALGAATVAHHIGWKTAFALQTVALWARTVLIYNDAWDVWQNDGVHAEPIAENLWRLAARQERVLVRPRIAVIAGRRSIYSYLCALERERP